MAVRLDERVVLVTGTSSGIGRALAIDLAARGAAVVGMARRQEEGDRLTSEIAASGGSFAFVRGDITKTEDCERAIAAAKGQFGRLDVLINNAAVGTPLKRVEESDDAYLDAIVQPTLFGTFKMCRAAIPTMREQAAGVIINVASTAGVDGGACEHFGAYGAAKAGVMQLTRVIAIENVDRGVRANVVVMGGVDTDMSSDVIESMSGIMGNAAGADANKAAAAGMFAKPEQVAQSIALLCAEESSEINGATINLDRCWSAGFWVSNIMHMAGTGALAPA
jgi:NAD(P)-dependent dehydrogenase (short-subunit alcohol dehydrogenase family)